MYEIILGTIGILTLQPSNPFNNSSQTNFLNYQGDQNTHHQFKNQLSCKLDNAKPNKIRALFTAKIRSCNLISHKDRCRLVLRLPAYKKKKHFTRINSLAVSRLEKTILL